MFLILPANPEQPNTLLQSLQNKTNNDTTTMTTTTMTTTTRSGNVYTHLYSLLPMID